MSLAMIAGVPPGGAVFVANRAAPPARTPALVPERAEHVGSQVGGVEPNAGRANGRVRHTVSPTH